jgi:hypothetical protein
VTSGKRLIAAACLVLCGGCCHAFQVGIQAGSRALYLQVGAGTITGGTLTSGGTPQDNATVNKVQITVPVASLGTGTALNMTTDSTVTNSPYDGRAFCAANQVYVGGGFRRTGGGNSTATLTVATTAASLVSGTNSIPFSEIAWTSGGINDTALISPGFFTGGTQTLLSIPRNTWFETCLTFSFRNTQVYPAGTFTGRAVYTLSAP